MYLHEPEENDAKALALLSAAASAPSQICALDPDTQRAFDESLRALAEDIVRYHPGLAHVLIGMSSTNCPFVHGQN
ncbi:MAG TPA: hypothetical protein PLA50_06645 [Bacteroidia bacterium]|nr:hypothetical protein [Bacteroidia bacterium]